MHDPRIKKLAKILVNHSTKIKKGEYVKIVGSSQTESLILAIFKEVIKKGAYPKVEAVLPGMNYIFFKNASNEQLNHFPQLSWDELKKTQVYIGIAAPDNTRELANIDPKKLTLRQKVIKPITNYVVNEKPKIRRCTTTFPTTALAQDADMPLQEYGKFLFSATNIDWDKESKKIKKINSLFENGKTVRIIGEDTDLTLSINKKNSIADCGEENMPGGEVFMAPVRNSLNGHIKFTYPPVYMGREVPEIYLEFKNGRVTKYNASRNKNVLKAVLNTDKNSCYVGELGIGCNPKIRKFTKNLLFDEKIFGTIHLALGMAYKENAGGNDSAVHWDIVKDLRNNGKIILDGKTIQENGKFLI